MLFRSTSTVNWMLGLCELSVSSANGMYSIGSAPARSQQLAQAAYLRVGTYFVCEIHYKGKNDVYDYPV